MARIVLILLLVLLGHGMPHASVHAQQASIEQSRQFRTGADVREFIEDEAEGADTGAAPVSAGDEDMGEQILLREKKEYQYFTVSGGTSLFLTDNAFLTETDHIHDAFFVGNAAAAARYPVSDLTTLRASASQAFYRYDQSRTLDFNAFDVYAGVTKVFPDLANLIASADYHYNRLTYPKDNADGPAGSEFYREHGVILGLTKVFPLSRAHYVFVGANTNLAWADPDTSQRNEYALQTGYHADLTRLWSADLVYRFAYFDYDGSIIPREDLNQTVSVSTGLTPWDWVTVSASALLGFNNSSNPELNYEYLNLGGAVNFQVSF